MLPIIPRVKLVIANHGTAIAAALVVVGLLAFAGAAWTVTHPPTVEVTERVATQTVGTDVETSTVVTGNTTLWDRGTTLENKPVYPLRSAPQLTVRMHTTVPTGQEVRVSQELTLVYRATKDDTVFWEAERLLVSEDRTVTTGSTSASATFDVREVRTHLDEINAEIRGLGRAQAYLRLNVTYQADGYSGSLSKTAPMAVLNSGYWIGGSLDAENTHQTPVKREVTQPPDTSRAVGLGLLGLLSLGSAGGVVYASSRRLDPAAIADELDRQRYREWVSTGRLGQFVSGQDVAMETLKDLVDVAIDSNNRVVHDRQRDLYAVVDDSVIYYYDPYHPEPEVDFEPEMDVPVQSDGGHTSAFAPGSGADAGMVAPRDRPAEDGTTDADAEDVPRADDGPPATDGRELPIDAVSVTREVDLEDGGIVATYRLETDKPAVSVEIVDGLLAECDHVESMAPLDGFGPAEHFDDGSRIGFRSAVPGGDATVVKYVVEPAEAATDDALWAIRLGPKPHVHRVVSAGDPADR